MGERRVSEAPPSAVARGETRNPGFRWLRKAGTPRAGYQTFKAALNRVCAYRRTGPLPTSWNDRSAMRPQTPEK